MALSAVAAASAGRALSSVVAQACGAALGRAFASNAASSQQSSATGKTSIVEPKYTYMPPGSSMREPIYFSMSDPVYYVDPKPDPSTFSTTPAPAKESPSAPTTVKKIDLAAVVGKSDNGRPVSYRMVDDLAQQGYVVNATTHSMRDPKYVSVSEPAYEEPEKQQSKK